MTNDLPDVLLIADLARLLRCSTRTIERRIARGLSMPKELRRLYDTRGSRRRWAKDDVLAWLTRDDEQPKARPHFRSHLRVAQGGMR